MKRGKFLASVIFICLVLGGCSLAGDSSEGVKAEITPLEEAEGNGAIEGAGQQLQQENGAGGEEGGAGVLGDGKVQTVNGYPKGEQIKEQTFDVTLRPLGQVTFASYEPETSENPLADVVFLIEQGDQVLCQLPGSGEGNVGLEMFDKVEAVSFTDYNMDNYDDIIIILSYYFGAGPQAAQTHAAIRYYEGTAQGNFIYQKEMSEAAGSALAEITIESAKSFIGAGKAAEGKLEPWQQAYVDYLTNECAAEVNQGYELIQLSNDEIPQIVEVGYDEATGCRIVCYADGKVHVNQTNRLYFSYIPGENLLCNSEGNMDYYYDLVYRLSGGELIPVASGYYGAEDNSNVQFDEEGNPIYQYEWNGVKMSKEEYQKELSKVYDESKAVTYSYDSLHSLEEMKQIIKNYLSIDFPESVN